jgi:hypothetical protein
MSNVRHLRRPAASNSPAAVRRLRANWPAELRVNGKTKPCTVIDISSDGANIRLPQLPNDGESLWLIIDDAAPIPVSIAWRNKGQAGVRFSEEQAWIHDLTRQRFDATAWIEA